MDHCTRASSDPWCARADALFSVAGIHVLAVERDAAAGSSGGQADLCGTVQPVWQRAGVPVSVGRALRIVPERTRRLVLDRDRGCRSGCVARAHLEVHHVVHWVDGGRTDLANLVAVCPFHHDEHHGRVLDHRGCERAGRVGVPGPGRVRDRAGPDLRPAPPAGRPGPTPGAARSAAGHLCPIGVSTLDPDSPGTRTTWMIWGLGYPDEDTVPELDGRDELWPGVGPPGRTRARPGGAAQQWVTFHEGPALLL